MKYFSFLVSLLLSLPANSEKLSNFERRYILASESIVHVRAVSAQENLFDFEGELDACGINYVARVLKLYKGDLVQKNIEFSSVFSLLVGEEYILLPGRQEAPPSLIVDWPKDYKAAYSKCEESLHSLRLSETNALLVWDYPHDLDGKWVMIEDENIIVGSEDSSKRRPCLHGEGECLFIQMDEFVSKV